MAPLNVVRESVALISQLNHSQSTEECDVKTMGLDFAARKNLKNIIYAPAYQAH